MIDHEEEGGARHILQVVPLANVQHSARATVDVATVVLAKACTNVVISLGFVLLQCMLLLLMVCSL